MSRVNLTVVVLVLHDDRSISSTYVLPGLLSDHAAAHTVLALYNEDEREAHESDPDYITFQTGQPGAEPIGEYEEWDMATLEEEYGLVISTHTADLPLTPRRPRPSRNRGRGTILGKPPID